MKKQRNNDIIGSHGISVIDEESKSRITTQGKSENVAELSDKTDEERMSDPEGPQSETESEKFENVSNGHNSGNN